jgi:hypothetical protein
MGNTRNYKGLFASRTVWGGLIALLAGVLGVFGISMDDATQQAAIEVGLALGSAIGGAVAIYGRIKASKRITPSSGSGMKALLLLFLPALLAGCALKTMPAHEQAVAIGQETGAAYVALHEEYLNLHRELPQARPVLEAQVAPVMDSTKHAVVALREAAALWRRTQTQPPDWQELQANAVRLLSDVRKMLQSVKAALPQGANL